MEKKYIKSLLLNSLAKPPVSQMTPASANGQQYYTISEEQLPLRFRRQLLDERQINVINVSYHFYLHFIFFLLTHMLFFFNSINFPLCYNEYTVGVPANGYQYY